MKRITLSLLLALLATTALASTDRELRAGQNGREAGIESYIVSSEDAGITAIGIDGVKLGVIKLYRGADQTRRAELTQGQGTLSITFDSVKGTITLGDGVGDDEVLSFDRVSGHWTRSIGDTRLVNSTMDFLAMSAVLADFEAPTARDTVVDVPSLTGRDNTSGGIRRIAPNLVQDPGDGGGSGSGTCTGYEVRGFGYGLTRSATCRAATNDANLQCWNTHCIGCCRLYDCDAACGLGDYGCFGGRTGIACAYRDTH